MPTTGMLGTSDSMLGNIELGGPLDTPQPVETKPMVLFEINWDDNPTIEFPDTHYTDVSHRVRAFDTRRGSNNFVDRVEAGTAVVTLDNRDGMFNFTEPGRLLMRSARLRAWFDHTATPLIVGHIESYRYTYPGVDRDAVCEVTITDGLKVLAQQVFPQDYQREAETSEARLVSALTEAGISTEFQNVDGAYIATDNIAPVQTEEFSTETTMVLAATLSDGSATITVASTAGLSPSMTVIGTGIPAGCTIATIVDGVTFTIENVSVPANGVARLSRTKDTQYNGLAGPWTTLHGISDTSDLSVGMGVGPYNDNNGNAFFATGTTITAIDGNVVTFSPHSNVGANFRGPSDAGGFMSGVPFTASTSQNLTFPRRFLTVSSILEHIRLVESTERGRFLVRADGVYEYQGSGWRSAQSVQLTFGEDTGSGEVPYREAPIFYDDTNLANEYNIRNIYNEALTQITDSTSQGEYFRRSQTIDQIWYASEDYSLPTNQRIFEPIPRLEGLVVQPVSNPTVLWPLILGLVISDRVEVRRRPLGGSDIFASYDQYVEAVEHHGDPSDWVVKFITSPVREPPVGGGSFGDGLFGEGTFGE